MTFFFRNFVRNPSEIRFFLKSGPPENHQNLIDVQGMSRFTKEIINHQKGSMIFARILGKCKHVKLLSEKHPENGKNKKKYFENRQQINKINKMTKNKNSIKDISKHQAWPDLSQGGPKNPKNHRNQKILKMGKADFKKRALASSVG